MLEFAKIVDGLKAILNWFTDSKVPIWLRGPIGSILVILAILSGILAVLTLISEIRKKWSEAIGPFNVELRRRASDRRRFADHIESEIRRLNNLEAWTHYRFAEMEAEIEADGRRRRASHGVFSRWTTTGTRREKSLSTAIIRTAERLVHLEGEPGSGKSVALRHLALRLARQAMNSKSPKSLIPLYINLKSLEHQRNQPVDANMIRSFVLQTINRINSRDVEGFLDKEFDIGLQERTWLFLFDSFDEIPEILSSTDADSTINLYSNALADFLNGMNQCTGIVASRHFRGPINSDWPRFRILPLTRSGREQLVRRAGLSRNQQTDVLGQLAISRLDMFIMAGNPMFLALLCEYVKLENLFPSNAHSIFESYIMSRFQRDTMRLKSRFHLESNILRATAEKIAFAMAADASLGLNPSRDQLRNACAQLGLNMGDRFGESLDALEFMQLGRSESGEVGSTSATFTFAHRRFQEYFATAIVLREPERVAPRQLLVDGRWRETAVVICQTQSIDVLKPILLEVDAMLEQYANKTHFKVADPIAYVNELIRPPRKRTDALDWHLGLYHLLGLLQDGLGGRTSEMNDETRMRAAQVILAVWETGSLVDCKRALEIAGILPDAVLTWLVRHAFNSNSLWLQEVAYQQACRLRELPHDVLLKIRQSLIRMAVSGTLNKEKDATAAYVRRLEDTEGLLDVFRMLLAQPLIYIVLSCATTIVFFCANRGLVRGVHAEPLYMLLLPILSLSFVYVTVTLWVQPARANLRKELIEAIVGTVTFYISLTAIPWLLDLLSKRPSVDLMPWPLAALLGYIMVWYPSTLLAAEIGVSKKPATWLFTPIYCLVQFVRDPAELEWSMSPRQASLLSTGIIYPLFWSAYNYSTKYHFTWVALALKVYWLYIVVSTFTVITLRSIAFVRETNHLEDWIPSQKNAMTATEFLTELNKYRCSSLQIKFVNIVRRSDLLSPTLDSVRTLQQIILPLRDLRNTNARPGESHRKIHSVWDGLMMILKPIRHIRQSQQLLQNTDNHWQIVGGFDYQLIDEIGALTEQIHLRSADNLKA